MNSCTLDTAARDQRLGEWHALRDEALISEDHDGGGSVSVFRAGPDVRRRLDSLIQAEAGCCSFLRFAVAEEGERITVHVTQNAKNPRRGRGPFA